MSVSLKKGSSVSLTKLAKQSGLNLSHVRVGLGWDVNKKAGGHAFDLDAWAFAIGADGTIKRKNLVYFANTLDSTSCIHHMGDNLTGKGDGDDELIDIRLDKITNSGKYAHILIGVTIYRGGQRKQQFGDVDNTFIRIFDYDTSTEICKYADQFKGELGMYTTMLFGVLSWINGEWEFNAFGRGSKVTSISSVLNVYGDFNLDQYKNNNVKEKKEMAVSLAKGGKVSLAKVASDAGIQSLTKIRAGLGWDVNRYDGGKDFDLDASAFLCKADGRVRNEKDFVFYGNTTAGGVTHSGDNQTGGGDGDDETILIDLTQIPADIEKVAFTVTIYEAEQRRQNFGNVENSYIHILDDVTGTELIRYDLGEDFSIETAIVVGELYRHNGEWKFNAIGSGFQGGLKALCANFGVDAE